MKSILIGIGIWGMFYLTAQSQNPVPLFLKNKSFDVVYNYDEDGNKTIVQHHIPFLAECHFDESTYYLRSDSIVSDFRGLYEYFKIKSNLWLEVITHNNDRKLIHFKILDEVVETDTIGWYGRDSYDQGIKIIKYNGMDTVRWD